MIRSRIALAVTVSLAAVHCTTNPASLSDVTPPTRRTGALTVPLAAGNGPYAMVVCRNRVGNDCGSTITDVASLNTALVPPDAWFATAALPIQFPAVHSWSLGQPINFWSYTGAFPDNTGAFSAPADMDLDDRSLFPVPANGMNQLGFTRAFTGFIALPAGTATTRTFAVATDDGYFLNVGGANAAVTISEFANSHRISYTAANTVEATFPSATQLYPFFLAAYQNTAASGVEFAWAQGAKATNTGALPSFTGGSWKPGNFSLVPGTQMYSPDVRATMSWSATGPATAGGVVTFHAVIENLGPVPALPAGTPPDLTAGGCAATDGLCFTLALPVSQFNPATIRVNGAPTAPANLTTTAANILVPISFRSAAANELSAGDSVSIDVSVAIATTAPATVRAQGRVTGHATDPSVFGGSVAPPYSLDVLTNDPTVVGTVDGGNRPAGFGGFSPENSPPVAANAVTLVSVALGGDDDDATSIVLGATPPTGPVLDPGVPAALSSSLNQVTIQGTTASAVPVRVELTNSQTAITQTQCNAFDGQLEWAWDTTNNVCACFLSTAATTWSCNAIALPDCTGNVACYTATAFASDNTGAPLPGVPESTRSISVVAPTANNLALGNGGAFHFLRVSGTASSNVPAVLANGATVHAVVQGPIAAGTCNATVAGGSWTCDAPITPTTCTAPCILDGLYSATASVLEANGADGPASVSPSFNLDSQPTLVAPATSNSPTPFFRGTLKGVPSSVLVCQAAATACSATGIGVNRALCVATGPAAINGGAWTCTPATNIAANAYTTAAYEADSNRNLSAPSLSQPLLVNGTRPSLDQFPANLLFNIVTSTLVGGGTCAPGEQVRASFTGNASLATATCSNTCVGTGTNGSWSCPMTIPVVDRTSGLSISVSQTAADSTISGPSIKPGFVVDTLAPRPPTFSAPASGSATRNVSPALQIAAAEAGGLLAVSIVDGTGQTVASCPPQAVPATGVVTCTPSPALADGTFTLMAVQTDLALNPSSPGTSTLRVKTRTASPIFSALAGLTIANPVQIEGTAEPGATVAVKLDDAAALPSVTADATGHFSVSAGVIATGSHFAQATATDFLGNSAPSTRVQFSVSLAGHVAGSSFGCSSAGGSGSYAALLLLGIVPLLGRRRKGMALVAAVAASAGAARADGTDLGLDSFRPASGGDGAIGVEGARPPQDGEASWEARGLLVGQSKPLVFVPDGGGQSQALIRSRVGGWLTGQAHVAGPLSLGLQLPFLVQQSGDLSPLPSNVSGGAILGGGLGDLRATARVGILRQERAGFDLSFQASADLPTAKKQSFLGDSAVQGEGLAAVGYRVAFSARSALDLLGNAFFRLRPSRDVLAVKTGSEIGLRAAVSWLPGGGPLAPQRVIFEAEGASFLRAGFGTASMPSEWRGGISYCAGPMTFDLGVGGGLAAGVGTPGLRIIGGVGYSPSVCNPNARPAPARPISPVRLVEVAPAPKPSAPAKTEDKPASVATATPPPTSKPRGTEVTMLPLPDLPPLPPAKAPKKRTVAQAEPLPAMPDLPGISALPLPSASRGAVLSGDRLELAKPVAFRGSRLPAKETMLDDVARLLSVHPEIELVAISAPDEARAKAVVAYLRKRGVAASRLRPEGRSEAVELRILRRR